MEQSCSGPDAYDPARVEWLFHRAIELPAAERADFLEQQCDGPLLSLVQGLLEADRDSQSFDLSAFRAEAYRAKTADFGEDAAEPLLPGLSLGPYRLIRPIGRGGMGTVFLAERADGLYTQQAAIKFVAPVSQAALASLFARERQILARLDHPAIVRLMDAGFTTDARPYLVMEYVDGKRITEYCDEHGFTIRERIRLFLRVCDAVKAAHQALIVHRDIKPSNVLVTPAGEPKLLDFGIAEVLQERDGGEPADATSSLAVLTPDYASPEQTRGEPAATTTDVYSLGTLLFELLTGKHPFADASKTLAEVVRAVQEDAAPKPSDSVASAPLQRELRGDLDHIVLHALEKQPAKRYGTVEAFVTDLERFLGGYPIHARREPAAGRAAKFARRHRAGVAAAVLASVLAVSGAISIVRSAAVARSERSRSERRFNELRDLAKSYIFELDPALEEIPGTTKVRALMTKRALAYLDRLSGETNGDTLLEREIANAYSKLATVQGDPLFANLGDRAGSRASIEKALRLRAVILAAKPGSVEDRFLLAVSSTVLGHIELTDGNPDAALRAHMKALRESEAILAQTPHPTGRLLNVAGSSNLYVGGDYGGNGSNPHLGNPAAALPFLRRGLELITREGEVRQHEATGKTANVYRFSNQALIEMQIGSLLSGPLRRPGEARVHLEDAIRLLHTPGMDVSIAEIRRKLLLAQQALAELLLEQGDRARARDLLRSCQSSALALKQADPVNVPAQSDYFATEALAGRELIASGRVRLGLTRIHAALDGVERIAARDRGNAILRSSLRAMYVAAGKSALKARQTYAAKPYFEKAAALARADTLAHPSDASSFLQLSEAERGLAVCSKFEGGADAARAHAAASEAAARRILAEHPDNPQAQALVAAATEAR